MNINFVREYEETDIPVEEEIPEERKKNFIDQDFEKTEENSEENIEEN